MPPAPASPFKPAPFRWLPSLQLAAGLIAAVCAARSAGLGSPGGVGSAVAIFALVCLPAALLAFVRPRHRDRFEEQARHAAKLALVAARTDNAVVITDTAGRVEWVNEGFTRITGYQLDEVVGRKPGKLLQGPDTDPATVAYIRQQLARGEGFSAEIVNYSKAGRKYWLAIGVQPVHDESGTLTNFIAIESDVTGAKRVSADLLAAKEQAEAASQAKSQFLANMSHEIRTPLNGVIGMADLLTRRGGLTDEQLRYARVIKSSADALLSLINDVLDFSKIEAGKLELSEVAFEPRTLVEDVVEMLAGRAQAKGLEFACRVDPSLPARLRGDPDRLRQVLINLVNNAIKFTRSGSVILSVEPAPSPDSRQTALRFAVTDTGIGIPPDRLDRLFKSFSQVDASTTRKYGGTGLGLAIAKQLSELMGGRIGVDSVEGRGSTFWFTASLARADDGAAAAAAATVPSMPGRPRLRVLAVDDHDTYRDIVREQLESWGYEVATAVDGAEALAALRGAHDEGRPFAAVVADLVMPRMDGLELGRAMRADDRFAQLAMLILTGMDRPCDAADREAAGIDACLAKPVRQSQLFDALATALARRRNRAAATAPAAARATAAPPGSAPLAAHVLLAEDNDVNQEVARELLTDAGCRVDVVGNGVEAVEAARRAPARYDVVLMDCQMPELDGFGASREIRRLERDGHVLSPRGRLSIIALTANAVEGDRDRCLAAGMDDYVTKPIDPDRLVATIRRVLAQASGAPSPSAESSTPATSDAPIDVPALLKRCQGKGTLADRLLGMFADGVAAQVASIRDSLASPDGATDAARLAHTIKGSASNLAADRVAGVAAELEHLARAGTSDAAAAALARLDAEVRACLAYLPEARAVARGGSAGKP